MSGEFLIASDPRQTHAGEADSRMLPCGSGSPLMVLDLGIMDYRTAFDTQMHWHEMVRNGSTADGVLLLVEHPPVITIGRRPGAQAHILADRNELIQRGVTVEATDRGGDITFHGPGQLVVYPIVPLNRYKLRIHDYMRLLEQAVMQTLARWDLAGMREPGATGVWVNSARGGADALAKICAIGIKLSRWISLHGLALNVTTDLSFFELINPCGLSRPVTSMRGELDKRCPGMEEVKTVLVHELSCLLGHLL